MGGKVDAGISFPSVRINVVRAAAPVTGRIVSNHLCMNGRSASFVRHTEIDVSGTALEGAFRAGQSFGVIPPGRDARGRPHKVRLYSIACPSQGEDGAGRVLSTTTKRLIDEYRPQGGEAPDVSRHGLFLGVCSNYLCDLRPGDEVQLTGPSGKRFLLPLDPDAHDYLFIATGTGIAPFRGFARELLERAEGPCGSRIHLVMGAPYTTDLLYHDLFTRLEEAHANFHYHTAISREPRPGARRGRYVHELIDEEFDSFRDLLGSPRTLVYLCGILGMQTGVFRVLAARGVADGYVEVGTGLAGTDPRRWADEAVRRMVRPTARCMVEVY
jgi:ferredoxin--NADP+ reductase